MTAAFAGGLASGVQTTKANRDAMEAVKVTVFYYFFLLSHVAHMPKYCFSILIACYFSISFFTPCFALYV